MQFKYISCKEIISRVYRDLNLQEGLAGALLPPVPVTVKVAEPSWQVVQLAGVIIIVCRVFG